MRYFNCHAQTCVSHFRRVSKTIAKGESFVMSVGPSVYVEQLGSRWVNFRERLSCRSLQKIEHVLYFMRLLVLG